MEVSCRPKSLVDGAARIVATADLAQKRALAAATAEGWRQRRLALGRAGDAAMPDRPGRPEKPELLGPRDMPKRTGKGRCGRVALIHALAHIELNAIDLTFDLIGRFARPGLPLSFFDDWVSVGADEARHFGLLVDRLAALDAAYGDLPAHDGLWQAAQATEDSLIARVAIVPLVLEARGLDVTPPMIARAREQGDGETADVLDVIYRDEKRHVAYGCKWFRYLCEREGLEVEPAFHRLVRTHFRGPLKPPFNDKARAQAGLTPGFYRPLAGISPLN